MICSILLLLLNACASGPAYIEFDGARFAHRTAVGWVHKSGEVALTVEADHATIGGHSAPIADLVSCDGAVCRFSALPSPFRMIGNTIHVDGRARGVVHRGDPHTALVMLATYRPPGPVTASVGGLKDSFTVTALEDGRIVNGEGCRWPTQCDLQVLGSWSADAVTLGGTVLETADLVRGEEVHAVANEPYVLRVHAGTHLRVNRGLTALGFNARPIRAHRPKDIDWDSQKTRAAALALAHKLVSRPVPPPPPP